MNEDQANTIIQLLSEMNIKLTDISDKLATDYEINTVCGDLKDIKSIVTDIKNSDL